VRERSQRVYQAIDDELAALAYDIRIRINDCYAVLQNSEILELTQEQKAREESDLKLLLKMQCITRLRRKQLKRMDAK